MKDIKIMNFNVLLIYIFGSHVTKFVGKYVVLSAICKKRNSDINMSFPSLYAATYLFFSCSSKYNAISTENAHYVLCEGFGAEAKELISSVPSRICLQLL